jgi:hypothetical protein
MFTVHTFLRRMRPLGRAALLAGLAACTKLPPFGADLGKQVNARGTQRAPYATTVRYDGWVAPGSEPDEIRDGKKMFYLYAWIPANSPELGVRMVSPARLAGSPRRQVDFVEPEAAARKATSIYFDTWVRFERCLAAVDPEDIAKPCQQWVTFGENDDSDELPANPSGQKYNALLRVASNVDDPLRVLVRGMYRIAFTSYKVGEVQGTYAAEVGSVAPLLGAALARTPAALATRVAQQTAHVITAAPNVQVAEDDTSAGATDDTGNDDSMPTWEQ